MDASYSKQLQLLVNHHINKYLEPGCGSDLIEKAQSLRKEIQKGKWSFSIPRNRPLKFKKNSSDLYIEVCCKIEGEGESIKKHNMELQVKSIDDENKQILFHIDLKNAKTRNPEPWNHLQVKGFESPRFPFPPMDLVLLCEFVLINFFPKESIDLRQDPAWKSLVLNSQELFIKDYLCKCLECLNNPDETFMGHLTNLP
jgi:hypothetical protein